MDPPTASAASGNCELSAVMIVYNGIRTVGRALDSLRFCDEIVVLDDCSTDGTWEYLQTRKDLRLYQRRHTTMAGQREYVTSLARGRWILTIDSDEYVTPRLAETIREAISQTEAPDGFYLLWRNPYPPTLRGELWGKHPRLMRAGRARWVQSDHLHSPLDFAGIRMGLLTAGHVEHQPLPNLAAVLRKYINKSAIMATQERAHGVRGSGIRLLLSTFGRFLKFYFVYGGWRYGASGLAMSCSHAFEAFSKQAFLIEAPVAEPEELQDGGPGSFPSGVRFSAPKEPPPPVKDP
jgi:glycosyltransferase involved in cell wall biosynthesis